MNTTETTKLLTKREVAAALNISWRSVENLMKRRLLSVVKIGRLCRFRAADVQEVIEKLTVQSHR